MNTMEDLMERVEFMHWLDSAVVMTDAARAQTYKRCISDEFTCKLTLRYNYHIQWWELIGMSHVE